MDFSEAYSETCSSVGLAARLGDLVSLQNLIWQGKPYDVRDNRGWTAIHEAAYAGNSGCLEFLLRQEDADLNWKTFEGETPLLLAARAGHLQCTRLLLKSGAEVNSPSNELYTPLWEAVGANSVSCAKCLLRHGADVNRQVFTGYSPLHLAAEKGYRALVELLLDLGAYLDLEADHKLTPIFLAAQFGHLGCLEILLKCAKDRGQLEAVNKTTTDNATPILIAAQEGHEECIKLLLTHNANPNIPVTDYMGVAAHFAIYKEHPRCLKVLLPVTDKDSLYKNVSKNMHPLIMATQASTTECLEILIDHGMDISTKLPLGVFAHTNPLFTTLQYSTNVSILCHVAIHWSLVGVQYLLNKGLPCNAQTPDELPPLLMSLASDNSDLFNLLLRHGANPNIYHSLANGNVTALMAIERDLKTLLTVTSDNGVKREIFGKYLCKLILSKAELVSCIRDIDRDQEVFKYNLYQVLNKCTMTVNLWPVLTLLFSFCSNLCIGQEFKKHVYNEDVISYFNTIENSTHSLSHACRRSIVIDLARRQQYTEDSIRSLPIPALLQDYLLFLDYGPKGSTVILDSMQRWTVHLEGGPRRVNHAAVAIGDKIYSFGGYCTGEDYETTRPMDIHVLDTISLRWTLIPLAEDQDNVPYQRYGHTCVGYQYSAYIWGGRNDKDGACNILYEFDSATLKWSKPVVKGNIPNARDGHSACVIGNKMYIFGGYEEEIDRFSNEIHCLHMNTFSWEPICVKGVPARWRDFHTATGLGNLMYVFGGRSDYGGEIFTNHEIYCNKIQIFDTSTSTWMEPVTSGIQPIGRRSHSAFVYKGNLYIFGGYNGLHDLHFRDIFRFDPVRMHWSMIKVKGQGPSARRRQCCCVIGDKVYLFGGTSPADIESSEPSEGDLFDHSDLHVLDFSPSLSTLCKLCILENKLDVTSLPKTIR
ncbi:ankyrin repeat and SOCS box protein 3-like [Saccostrea echinata]|uniref:ankyrin repeat and SOCS box protein 3-like n=1 Tax=Saccostrea echinata TaxID=191078 RepID=UPI002A7F4D57|nr:ankyrin repeat and SOCS box protein 3-like [Saccostrea echinata]